MYGGKPTDNLNHMRYLMYMTKASSFTSQPRPERLPPTENAARYHIYRVHLQVVQWKTLMTTDLKPEDWGWKIMDGRYEPILTDLAAAPDDILSVVRCKCKIEGRRPCTTQLCSCMKHGLSCVAACKNCNGEQCENTAKPTSNLSDSDNGDEPDMIHPNTELVDMIPEDVMQFDIPWLDEEEVRQVFQNY